MMGTTGGGDAGGIFINGDFTMNWDGLWLKRTFVWGLLFNWETGCDRTLWVGDCEKI